MRTIFPPGDYIAPTRPASWFSSGHFTVVEGRKEKGKEGGNGKVRGAFPTSFLQLNH